MYPRENPTAQSGPRSLSSLDLHLQFYRHFRRRFLPRCLLEKTRILEGHLTALSQRWLLVAPKFARVLRSNRQIKSGRCGVRVWRQQRNTLISWSWRSRLELELESEQFVIFETLHKFVSFGRCTDGQAGSKDYGRRLGKPSGWTAWALQPAALFQSRFASPNLTFHCSPIFFHLSQPWRWWWDVPRSPRITLSHSAVVQGLSIKCHIMLPFCDCQWGLCVHFRQHLGPLHYSAQMINWHKVRILEDCLQMTDCPICLLLTSVTPKQWQEVTPIMGNSKTWPFYPFSIAI